VRLAFRLMQIPAYREMAVRRSARLHGELFPATNRLIGSYPGADGVKTGFTDDAGWCIVASAWRDGRRVYVAVLGAPDQDARDRAARALLDWAFSGD
jgi:D-alanyl-D-alanine carboxypeptidase (penicillin-binding protein 5/6)